MISNHIPVLLKEVIDSLKPFSGGVYIDCTLGGGGYTKAILNSCALSTVFGFDIDKSVENISNEIKKEYHDRFTFVNSNFDQLVSKLKDLNISQVDGIVADLGVSSMQLDSKDRGFSFMHDSNLDMRLSGENMTAQELINYIGEEDLANIIFNYGNERFSRRIARNIIAARAHGPIKTTFELAKIVRASIPFRLNFKIDSATKTFQAIRIHLNDELGNLTRLLNQAHLVLKPGGTLSIVSFHELEDRIVKNYINTHATKKVHVSKYHTNLVSIQPNIEYEGRTHKLFLASDEEVKYNHRSRSAKLRTVKKLAK